MAKTLKSQRHFESSCSLCRLPDDLKHVTDSLHSLWIQRSSYGLASTLNSQLDDLSLSLTGMIDIVNGLSSTSIYDSSSASQNGTGSGFAGGGGGADPIAQIEAILNAHLGSLQWIDGAVKELEGKVKEVEARQQQQDRLDGGGSEASSLYESGPRRGYGLGRT